MNDTPTPPEASGETPAQPTPPASPAKRPWTILGRLSQAVREQNWFAVVLELAIVVLGVVIGFQVTSWGQDRADRAQEQEYLRQLVEDLKQTERTFETLQPRWSRRDDSATMLVRSFRSARTPPVDSVLLWAYQATLHARPAVVTGTAVALVETGDLNLIRDDSLRSAITGYLGTMDQLASYMLANVQDSKPHINTLRERIDDMDVWRGVFSSAEPDSSVRAWPMYPIPETPLRAFAPLDVEALFRDRVAYAAVRSLWQSRAAMESNRARVLAATVALREHIEAKLDP